MNEFILMTFSSTLGTFLALMTLLIVSFVTWHLDHEILSSIIVIGFVSALWYVGVLNFSNILNVLMYIGIYLGIGFLYSIIGWIGFVRKRAQLLREFLADFNTFPTIANVVTNSPEYIFTMMKSWPNIINSHHFNTPELKQFQSQVNYLKTYDEKLASYPNPYEHFMKCIIPNVSNHIGLVFAWIVYWPCKLLGDIFTRYLHGFVVYLIMQYRSVYNRISAHFFKFD